MNNENNSEKPDIVAESSKNLANLTSHIGRKGSSSRPRSSVNIGGLLLNMNKKPSVQPAAGTSRQKLETVPSRKEAERQPSKSAIQVNCSITKTRENATSSKSMTLNINSSKSNDQEMEM